MPGQGNIHSNLCRKPIILLFHIAIVPLCNASIARAFPILHVWYAELPPRIRRKGANREEWSRDAV